MKKLRVIYDILTIIFVFILVAIILFLKFSNFDALAGSFLSMYTILAIISYLYSFSIIGLSIYVYTKTKEQGSLAATIIGCIIIPFVVPILLYLFAIRRSIKKLKV